MNRSLLLIVCDFLLLSLLALAEFEKSGQPVTAGREDILQESIDESFEDDAMMDLLASALAAEQNEQSETEDALGEALQSLEALEEAKRDLSLDLLEKEEEIVERERLLAEAEEKAAELLESKSAAEKREDAANLELQRLTEEKEKLDEEAAALAQNVEALSATAERSDEELIRRSERVAQLESELQSKLTALNRAEAERSRLDAERIRLEGEVNVAEREKELLASTLASAKETIDLERQERQRLQTQTETLSEGVSRLAEASDEITEEVKGLRPLTANEIFSTAEANHVTIQFSGKTSGLFGDSTIESTTKTLVTQIGGQHFLWIHLSQTPFAQKDRRRFFSQLEAFLESNGTRFRIPQMGLLKSNPSLLFLPLSEAIVSRLGVEVYSTTETPFRFDELIVLDLDDARFGESGFRIESAQSDLIEVDNKVFSALFGEFSPAAGDLALTRSGDFLGIVLRGGTAWMAGSVDTAGKITFGDQFSRSQLDQLP
ncbi:MAG: hypothetical protein AAGJ81_01710 [Verrucomicrobiota bacterium]